MGRAYGGGPIARLVRAAPHSTLERPAEAAELLAVAHRCPVPEEDEPRLQLAETLSQAAVLRRVRREVVLGQPQPARAGEWVVAVEDIADDERPVALAPQGDVPARVAGDVEHREPCDLVALPQAPRHGVRRAGERPPEDLVDKGVGLTLQDEMRVLDGVRVALPGPQRDPEALAHRLAGALVVGVGVGHDVRGERAAAEVAHDLTPAEASASVH